MMQVLRRLALFAAFGTGAVGAQAADITVSDGQGMGCFVRIDGPVAQWDTRSLRSLLSELPEPDPGNRVGRRVCLDSVDGSLDEAVRLADEIALRSLGTAVPDGAACESACAVLFLAGRFSPEGEDGAVRPDRLRKNSPRLTMYGDWPCSVCVSPRAYSDSPITASDRISVTR